MFGSMYVCMSLNTYLNYFRFLSVSYFVLCSGVVVSTRATRMVRSKGAVQVVQVTRGLTGQRVRRRARRLQRLAGRTNSRRSHHYIE